MYDISIKVFIDNKINTTYYYPDSFKIHDLLSQIWKNEKLNEYIELSLYSYHRGIREADYSRTNLALRGFYNENYFENSNISFSREAVYVLYINNKKSDNIYELSYMINEKKIKLCTFSELKNGKFEDPLSFTWKDDYDFDKITSNDGVSVEFKIDKNDIILPSNTDKKYIFHLKTKPVETPFEPPKPSLFRRIFYGEHYTLVQ